MPDRVGGWEKGMSGGKEVGGEDMSNLLEMGIWGEGTLQQEVCYRAGDGTGLGEEE